MAGLYSTIAIPLSRHPMERAVSFTHALNEFKKVRTFFHSSSTPTPFVQLAFLHPFSPPSQLPLPSCTPPSHLAPHSRPSPHAAWQVDNEPRSSTRKLPVSPAAFRRSEGGDGSRLSGVAAERSSQASRMSSRLSRTSGRHATCYELEEESMMRATKARMLVYTRRSSTSPPSVAPSSASRGSGCSASASRGTRRYKRSWGAPPPGSGSGSVTPLSDLPDQSDLSALARSRLTSVPASPREPSPNKKVDGEAEARDLEQGVRNDHGDAAPVTALSEAALVTTCGENALDVSMRRPSPPPPARAEAGQMILRRRCMSADGRGARSLAALHVCSPGEMPSWTPPAVTRSATSPDVKVRNSDDDSDDDDGGGGVLFAPPPPLLPKQRFNGTARNLMCMGTLHSETQQAWERKHSGSNLIGGGHLISVGGLSLFPVLTSRTHSRRGADRPPIHVDSETGLREPQAPSGAPRRFGFGFCGRS